MLKHNILSSAHVSADHLALGPAHCSGFEFSFVSSMGGFSLPAFRFIDVVVSLLVLYFSKHFSMFVVGVVVSSSIESRGDGDWLERLAFRPGKLARVLNVEALEGPEKRNLGADSQGTEVSCLAATGEILHEESSWGWLIHKLR